MKKAYNFFWKKIVANKKHEEGMLRVSGFQWGLWSGWIMDGGNGSDFRW
jgi:hypothetical protein